MTKNSKFSIFAAIPLFVLCFVLRLVQICLGTDMNTGFLYDDNSFIMDYGFYGAVILTLAAVIALIFLDAKRGSFLYNSENNIVAGLVDSRIIPAGFALVLVGAAALYEGFEELKGITPSPLILISDGLFGLGVLIVGFVVLYKKEIKPALGFAFSIGAVFFTLRGMGIFMDMMSVASVPENLIKCLTVIGEAVFFMLLAKLLSGNESRLTRHSLVAVGATTAVMTLASAMATITAGFAGSADVAERITGTMYSKEVAMQVSYGNNGYLMAYTPWVDVICSVFIILMLAAMFMKSLPENTAELVKNTENIVSDKKEEQ